VLPRTGTNSSAHPPPPQAALSRSTMTVSSQSKRGEKQGHFVSIKSRLPAKRNSPTKASRLESLRTTFEILDEATKMLIPLSLEETCVESPQCMDDTVEYRPSPLQPDDRRRRMLRRGSKCPQMFFQDLQSWKRRSSPSSISLPSLVLQGASSSAKIKLFELPRGEQATALSPAIQAIQEGAKAA
jgi:hypothetical protein